MPSQTKKRIHKKHLRKHLRKHKGGNTAKALQKPFTISSASYPVGYSWNADNVNTWPGVKGNNCGITMSNHIQHNREVIGAPISSSNTQCGPCSIGGGRKTTHNNGRTVSKVKRTSKHAGQRFKTTRRRHRRRPCPDCPRCREWGRPRRLRNSRSLFRGGNGVTALIPQELVNFGRGILYNTQQLVADWKGKPLPAAANPSNTIQPINKEV
jgi:hypothetical protein